MTTKRSISGEPAAERVLVTSRQLAPGWPFAGNQVVRENFRGALFRELQAAPVRSVRQAPKGGKSMLFQAGTANPP